MADAPRPRPVEYYNPRPLILGICFFWGIAIGFCLFYFSPPKQMIGAGQKNGAQEDVLPQATMSEIERRRLDTPDIADVAPAIEAVQTNRLRIETMELEPPAPVLTTEGGLSGRTAHALRQPGSQQYTGQSVTQPPPSRPPQPMMAPPPIPELMP